MFQRKRLTAVLAVVVTVALLAAGCSARPAAPQSPAPAQPAPAPASQPATTAPAPEPAKTEPAKEAPQPAKPLFDPAKEYQYSTGQVGGTWYPVGVAMADVWKEAIGIKVTVAPGAGAANVAGVDQGLYDFGLSLTTALYDATQGNAPFKQQHNKFRTVMNIYASPVHIFVRADSDIKTVQDLKGKRIAGLPRGTGMDVITRQIFDAYGWDVTSDVKFDNLDQADAADGFKDGRYDAYLNGLNVRAAHFVDLTTAHNLRLLPIDDDLASKLIAANPGYVRQTIPAGSYKNIDTDVPSLGLGNAMIVHESMPDDLVYELTRLVFANKEKLVSVHAIFKDWNTALAVGGIQEWIHPGALRYYKEIGAIK